MNKRNQEYLSIMHKLHRRNLSELTPLLTKAEFFTLGCIEGESEHNNADSISVTCIVKALHEHSSAVSRTLSGLEDKNYIKRFADSKDRRNTLVSITKEGHEALQETKQSLNAYTDAVILKYGYDKMDSLLSALNEFNEISEKEFEERKRMISNEKNNR